MFFLVGNVKDGCKIHCWGHCKSYSKIWRIEVGYTFQVTQWWRVEIMVTTRFLLLDIQNNNTILLFLGITSIRSSTVFSIKYYNSLKYSSPEKLSLLCSINILGFALKSNEITNKCYDFYNILLLYCLFQ